MMIENSAYSSTFECFCHLPATGLLQATFCWGLPVNHDTQAEHYQ